MTIREKLTELLTRNGMWPNDAFEVMEEVISSDTTESMIDRWNDVADGYPKPFLALLWFMVRQKALEWIDANCPKAFYRSLFENKQ